MKNKRHEALLKIISESIVQTQEELQEMLISAGYPVTQSTVSRDIKQLRIVKTHDSEGNYRYISRSEAVNHDNADISKYIDVFVSSVKSIEYAINDVVIKCYPGMASGACVTVDAVFHEMIVGSLAGDDTVLVITKSEKTAEELTIKLRELL